MIPANNGEAELGFGLGLGGVTYGTLSGSRHRVFGPVTFVTLPESSAGQATWFPLHLLHVTSLLPAWTTRHCTLRSQFLLNLIRSQQHMRITCFPSQWAAYSQIAFLDILHITRCLELAYVCFLRTENSRFRLFSHYLNQGHKHICLNHYLINLMHNDLY